MLESILLTDFQKFKKLKIVFDPTVTTIIGATDAGKSSVLRALGILMLNQPTGGSFIRKGSEQYALRLEIDGQTIRRRRGSKVNTYKLDDKIFKSFGMGNVPDDIAKLANVDEINFQWQLDSPFWFLETPGQVSRNLNEIVNLETIDKSLSYVGSELRKAKNELEVSQARYHEFKEKKKQLVWIMEMDGDLGGLEKIEGTYHQITQDRSRIDDLLQGGTSLIETRDRLSETILCGQSPVEEGSKVLDLHSRVTLLEDLIKNIEEAKSRTSDPTRDFDSLLGLRTWADSVAENRRGLDLLVEEISKLEEDQCQLKEQLEVSEKELLEKTEGKCPVCGQVIASSHLLSLTCTSPIEPQLRDRTRTGMKYKRDT